MKSNYRDLVFPVLATFKRKDRVRFYLQASFLLVTNLLDLIGLLLMGLLVFTGVNADATHNIQIPGSRIVLEQLGLRNISELAIAVVLVFLTKSIFGLWASRELFDFLAIRTSEVSGRLFREIIRQKSGPSSTQTSQDLAVILTFGSQAVVFDALGYGVIAASEIILVCLIGGLLVFLLHLVGILVIIYFSFISFFLNAYVARKSRNLELANKLANVESIEIIQSSLNLRDEIAILDKNEYFLNSYVSKFREQTATIGKLQLLGIMPKYLLESFLVLGALILGAIASRFGDGQNFFVQMTLILTAASRVMPSILRLQSSLTQISRSKALSPKVNAILNRVEEVQNGREVVLDSSPGFPVVIAKGISFKYPESDKYVIQDCSFEIPRNSIFCIVGSSGSGKTTMLNLMLGFVEPTEGFFSYSSSSPLKIPSFSIVPQNPQFLNSSIRENIALGVPRIQIDDLEVIKSLKSANIFEEVMALPNGLDERLGESFRRFSGGQRQRLNIARALYAGPEILVFDEPTSALDELATEKFIQMIQKLSKIVTIVLVTHDVSLKKKCDYSLEL